MTAKSSIDVHQQTPMQAHIYTPGIDGTPYKLIVKTCDIYRGIGIVTNARVTCIQAYTTELGGTAETQPKGYMVPAAPEQDSFSNKYITIGMPVKPAKQDGATQQPQQYLRPLFTGIITGVSSAARMGVRGTATELVLQCAAPIHKLSIQQIGGSWYYARALDPAANGTQISKQYTQIANIRRGFSSIQTNAPLDIVTALTNQLGAGAGTTAKSAAAMRSIFQILNQLHILISRAIANNDLNPKANTQWQLPDSDKLSSMLDANWQVKVSEPSPSNTNGSSWLGLWYENLAKQLVACVAASPFMSAINMLTQDRFRMLNLVPVPLSQQPRAQYGSYSAPSALMRICAQTSILHKPIQIGDTATYMIDNIGYTADYNGLLQRPDQLVLYAAPRASATSTQRKAVPSLYFVYPKPASTSANATVRRTQIQAPQWLNWCHIKQLYESSEDTQAVINPYAQMLYAQLYNTYGSLTVSGAIKDVTHIPFDDYIGKVIRFRKPQWTLPYLPNNKQPENDSWYTGRVQTLSISYVSSAVDQGATSIRYNATVRVIPDSVYNSYKAKADSQGAYIQNKIYTEPEQKVKRTAQ